MVIKLNPDKEKISSSRFFETKNGILYKGDSRQILKEFEENSFDLVITSPPYKDSDGYSENLIYDIFKEVFRVQKRNTLCFLNFGHLAEDKFRPFRVCQILLELGYQLNDTITWVKNHYRPIQGSRRLNNLTEFIFLLYKENMPKIDRLAIGIPYIYESNATRWKAPAGKNLKCRGNVWEIKYETVARKKDKLHNDRFPIGLPEFCIKLSSYADFILDPFFGSGTTGYVAEKMNKKWVGIEINKENCEISKERIYGTDLFFK